MVILRPFYILAALLITFSASAQEVNVAIDINQGVIYTSQPVGGLISVTHPTPSPVDVNSFKLGSGALTATLVREVPVGSNSTLSIYQFQAPGQPPGLYVLPPISVKVGDGYYKSPLTSYEVKAGGNGAAAPAPASATTATPASAPTPATPAPALQTSKAAAPTDSSKASLQLKAFVDGPSSIYPGQRTRLAYKLSYVGDIDLKEEHLPFLKPDGLRKIGDIDTDEGQEGNASTLVIHQIVEAVNPGKYTYGPSVVNGVAYVQGPGGSKAYLSPPLKTEAPPVTITVLPFPGQDKPASFNGAIGPVKMDVKLLSPATVNVGDKITLQVNLTGDVVLENLPAPNICCQPGFSGLFKTNDLPPPTSSKGNTKTFTIDLWPLSKEIKDIPPIEYAYFNPKTSAYEVIKSDPIAINVQPTIEPVAKKPEESSKEKTNQNAGPIKPLPIEIQTIFPLKCSDLHNTWFGTWDALILLPLAGIFLIIQNSLHDALERRRKQVKIKTSQELYKETESHIDDPKLFFPLLNQTLITWLKEKGEIPNKDVLPEPEELPENGVAGEVRKFLSQIQEKRFTGQDEVLPRQEILNDAKQLMRNGRNGK